MDEDKDKVDPFYWNSLDNLKQFCSFDNYTITRYLSYYLHHDVYYFGVLLLSAVIFSGCELLIPVHVQRRIVLQLH